MLVRTVLLFSALASCADAQFPDPDAAAQKAIISRMRSAALGYGNRLQDFICIQLTVRSADRTGTGKRWKPLETQEQELSYVSHKEHYKLLKVNGESPIRDKSIKPGYFIPGGEFGTALQRIFDPAANAEFEWDHGELSAGKRSCVFRYRVPVATSITAMQVNLNSVKLGHRGFVSADCDSGAATRIQMESDPTSVQDSGRELALGWQLDVRYGPAMIGSIEFLLPQEAEEIVRFGKKLTKAEIRFQQYRKYDSSSSITFGTGKTAP
jgi:hypothetical protein